MDTDTTCPAVDCTGNTDKALMLYDMYSAEDIGGEQHLTIGGDEPCPFCNTDEWLENVIGVRFDTKEEALECRDRMAKRWNIKIEE